MKKLLLLLLLIPNLVMAVLKTYTIEKIPTNISGAYAKNFKCISHSSEIGHWSTITFNLVNKSSKSIRQPYLVVYDKDMDPIDEKFLGNMTIVVNSGKAFETFLKSYRCEDVTHGIRVR